MGELLLLTGIIAFIGNVIILAANIAVFALSLKLYTEYFKQSAIVKREVQNQKEVKDNG